MKRPRIYASIDVDMLVMECLINRSKGRNIIIIGSSAVRNKRGIMC